MLKHLILLSLTTIFWLPAIAQEETPVILLASRGKIKYQSPGHPERQTVISGAVLKKGGILSLKKSGYAVVFCDGQLRQLRGKQPVSLAEQFPENKGMVKLNFDMAFGEHVLAAVSMAAHPGNSADAWGSVKTASGSGDGWGGVKTVSGSGDGWGGVKTVSGSGDGWGTVKTATGTGDGWGGKGQKVIAIHPFGKLSGATTTLSWSRPAGGQTFQVKVMDSQGKPVAETTTKDTSWVLNLAQLKLSEGRQYQWSITPQGDQTMTSNVLSFEVGDGFVESKALQKLESSEIYQQSPEALQGLMQAVAFEQSELYSAAARTYLELQKANPRDKMIRLMHAAFWMRYGLKPVAERAYKS